MGALKGSGASARLGRAVRRLVAPLLGTTVAVATARPWVALTFDDGPDPDVTPALLDLLERRGAGATFFVLGSRAERHSVLLERIAAGGHALANHGWSHASFPRLSRAERRRELVRTERSLGRWSSGLVRPPYGHLDPGSWFDLRALGLEPITWSAHVEDWRPASAETLRTRLEREVRPGAVVLLHDRLETIDPESAGAVDRAPLLQALAETLDRADPSTRFVTLPELLDAGTRRKVVRWRRGDDAWMASLIRTSTTD